MEPSIETTVMTCPACGQETPTGSAFCSHCGQRLDATAAGHVERGQSGTPRAANEATPSARTAAGDASIYTEEELWTGRYSPRDMVGTYIAAGLVSLGIVIGASVINHRDVWLGALVVILLMVSAAGLTLAHRRLNIRYRLTTQRLIQESGILTLRTDRIDIIDINDITVEQGPIQRLMGLGAIKVASNDRTHADLVMPGIENVNHVADLMDNARRAVQRRRGLRIDVNPGEPFDHQQS